MGNSSGSSVGGMQHRDGPDFEEGIGVWLAGRQLLKLRVTVTDFFFFFKVYVPSL